MFIIGIFAGFSFMVNIRAIVLFVPFAIIVAIKLIKEKEFLNLILVMAMGFFGVFVSIFPYLIYAICTDSLYDFYKAVIYTNFAYTNAISNSFSTRMEFIKGFILRDTFYIIYAFFSFIALFFIKFNKYFKISIILSYFIGLCYIIFTGKDYLYYFVVVIPYFAFGIILLIKIFEKILGKLCYIEEKFSFKIIFLAIFLILLSYVTSYRVINNSNKNCISRSRVFKTIFKEANIDVNKKKLLALGFEPMIYTNLDIVPQYKYFFTPDLSYKLCPEPFKGQVDYVVNLDPDIIVLSAPFKHRELVMSDIFSMQDAYRMRDAIRTNYKLLSTYDMDDWWGTYQIYIRNDINKS